MNETIIIIVQRKSGRKRLTIERAFDGGVLAALKQPEEMWWWQLQRCRRELDDAERKSNGR
jgi:DNA-binding transcriptional regulator YdaS (Cro superfamily)